MITTSNLRPTPETYNNDLVVAGSSANITLMDVIYHLEYFTALDLRLPLRPANPVVPVVVDVKRSSQYDVAVTEGSQTDTQTLSSEFVADAIIFNRSREQHRTLIRQQNPVSGL